MARAASRALVLTRSILSILNQPRKTRSTKPEPNTVPSQYEEIKVPGGAVDWLENKQIVKEYRFPTVVRISRSKTKASTINPSMLQRLLLVEEWLVSTLVLWWTVVASAMAGGAWGSQVFEVINAWTARLPKIGRGRDTYVKEQLEDFSTRAGKIPELQ